MTSHYIRIRRQFEEWAHHVKPDDPDWIQALFDDVTEDGRRVYVLHYDVTEQGPRIALYGDFFVAVVGEDAYRSDTLFVSKILSAGTHLPKEQPRVFEASFRALVDGERAPMDLDPVGYLIREVQPSEPEKPPRRSIEVKPTPRLVKAVELVVCNPLLEAFRPPAEEPPAANYGQRLERLRLFWSRFRLGHAGGECQVVRVDFLRGKDNMNRAPDGAFRTIQEEIDAINILVDEPDRFQGLDDAFEVTTTHQ